MKRITSSLFVLALLAAACGGGPAPATQRPGSATVAPGQPTLAANQPTAQAPAPVPGSGTAVAILTGGPDAGTYTGNEPPNCSQGIVGPTGWGVQYSTTNVDDKGLGSVQLISATPGEENDENAFFQGLKYQLTVTIGPSLGATSRDYEVKISDEETSGTGSAQVTDNGTTAVIHATGTTPDGVAMEVTITCPTITRA